MSFKNEIQNWEDIRLFLRVARASGLSGAVEGTGMSAATLGRRVSRLERELGVELFEKRQTGYKLTGVGEEFFEYAVQFEDRAAAIERWRQGQAGARAVRIAAGSWTAWFITRHIGGFLAHHPGLRLEMVTGAGFVDLLRREAHIGVRNRRPSQPGLVGRRLASVGFAIYGVEAFSGAVPALGDWSHYRDLPWVGAAEVNSATGANLMPSAKWMHETVGAAFVYAATEMRLVLDAAVNGLGICVLPRFVGDSVQGLVRLSPDIPDLRHDQWLVVHEEERHVPAVRHVLDELAALMGRTRGLIGGMDATEKKVET